MSYRGRLSFALFGHKPLQGIDFSLVPYLLSWLLGMQPISHLSSNPSIAFDF